MKRSPAGRRWFGVIMVTPGFRDAPGGVESHTSALTKELARQDVKVLVLTAHRGGERTRVLRYDDCWVVSYRAWSMRSMSISPRLAFAAIRSRRCGRVMHVHSFHATTAFAILGGRAPTVFTPHYHGRRGHSGLANLLHHPYHHVGKFLFRRCDAVICKTLFPTFNLFSTNKGNKDRHKQGRKKGDVY